MSRSAAVSKKEDVYYEIWPFFCRSTDSLGKFRATAGGAVWMVQACWPGRGASGEPKKAVVCNFCGCAAGRLMDSIRDGPAGAGTVFLAGFCENASFFEPLFCREV